MDFTSRQFDFTAHDRTAVVAEIGVNHNGDESLALRMIDAAVAAGAHIVKFQAFRAEKEISRYADKAAYQKETTASGGGQLEMARALELSPAALERIYRHCESAGVGFLCAVFDFESADLLLDGIGARSIKLGSSEITNLPLLQHIGAARRGVVLSTGASTLGEVGRAVDALREAGCPELVLLHCVSSYPTPVEQSNLRAMRTLREAFRWPVGFSDHTEGIAVAVAAAALGAVLVEKHFTLDRSLPGPDHRASIEPGEFTALVRGVREANAALGSPMKQPAPCELGNLPLIRKSLVAGRALSAGTRLTRDMIEIKRPLGGIEPGELDRVVGLTLAIDIDEDQPITWQHLRRE